MKPSIASHYHFRSSALAVASLLPLCLDAADLYWDGNGSTTGVGGGGTGSQSGLFWRVMPSDPTLVAWAPGSKMIFDGVTSGGDNGTASVGNVFLGFTATGVTGLQYSGTGTWQMFNGTIALDPAATVDIGNTVVFNGGTVTSTGFTKTGAGSLQLFTGLAGLTGTITHDGGSISIRNSASLGSSALLVQNGLSLNTNNDANTVFGNAVTIADNAAAFAFNVGRASAGATGVVHTFGNLSLGARTVNFGQASVTSPGISTVVFGATTLTGNAIVNMTAGATSSAYVSLASVAESGGSFGLTKQGTGTLYINGPSTYTGLTSIDAGTLRLNAANAFNTGSNILLNGTTANAGVLELHSGGPSNLNLGTGGGEVRWASTADGGFSAADANLALSLNGNAPLVWGSTANFVNTGKTLILSSATSNGTLNLSNAIDLNAAARTVQVSDGLAAVDAELSGVLSGAGSSGLTKTGAGTLYVSNLNNTYTGTTLVSGGALRLANNGVALSPNSNVTLAGGVLELPTAAITDITLGTGVNQVQFTGAGGFSSGGSNLTLSLNGGAGLTWGTGGTTNFVPSASALILGATSSAGTLTLSNNIALNTAGHTVTANNGAADVDAALSGNLTGSFGLTKNGTGTLLLSGTNTYSGQTVVNAGSLRLANAAAWSTAGNTLLNAGSAGSTLELPDIGATWSKDLGTAAGQLQITGPGGLAAVSGTVPVSFNGNAAITWGTGGTAGWQNTVNPFWLGSATTAGTLEVTNAFVFNTQIHTIQANDGAAAVDGRLSGAISGSFGLTKTGAGTLELTGANTYAGTTLISAGALRLGNASAWSATSNINSAGGVLELTTGIGNLTLGTGVGQVQFTGAAGGLSAAGGNLTLSLNNNAALTWGAASFVPGTFILGSTGSNSTLTLSNAISFGAGARAVQVDNGSAAVDAVLSGVLSGTGSGGLVKRGTGTLGLSAASTYAGGTAVEDGKLVLMGGDNRLPATSVVTLGVNNQTTNASGFNTAALSGKLQLGDGTTSVNQTLGGLVTSGSGAANSVVGGGSGTSILTLNIGTANTYNGVLGGVLANENNLALVKTGAGTLILNGVNTATGLTTISAGTIALGSSGSIAGSLNLGTAASAGTFDLTAKSSYTFDAGQTLSGVGTINIGAGKTITALGAVAPGNSTGTMNITGDFTLGGTTTLEIAGNGGVAGTDFDRLAVSGTLTYGGHLNIVSYGSYNIDQLQSYGLMTFGSNAGSFTSVTVAGTTLSYNASLSQWEGVNAGFFYALNDAAGQLTVGAVPEPAASALVFGGLALIAGGCRRNRRRTARQ